MEVDLTEEQQMVRDMVRAFAQEQVRPGAAERDRSEEFPAELYRQMAELGLLGMMVPEEYGGAGVDVVSYLFAVEELARADASVAVGMSVTTIYEGTSEVQKMVIARSLRQQAEAL